MPFFAVSAIASAAAGTVVAVVSAALFAERRLTKPVKEQDKTGDRAPRRRSAAWRAAPPEVKLKSDVMATFGGSQASEHLRPYHVSLIADVLIIGHEPGDAQGVLSLHNVEVYGDNTQVTVASEGSVVLVMNFHNIWKAGYWRVHLRETASISRDMWQRGLKEAAVMLPVEVKRPGEHMKTLVDELGRRAVYIEELSQQFKGGVCLARSREVAAVKAAAKPSHHRGRAKQNRRDSDLEDVCSAERARLAAAITLAKHALAVPEGTLDGRGAVELAELEREWAEVQRLHAANPGMSGCQPPNVAERLAGLRAHIALDLEQTSAMQQRLRDRIESGSALLA
eukprot:NODE_10526_length_1345_cov_9.253695.p1 GENE.NODE_10526_length_1345_cov_9.253695~~NODE_10526_length_1345_cov_9.253695.p1  ORF type:complete len:339 (-),score=42.71 NODE_10526_length_1345_cov_9.253695:183-1199(-)